MLKITPPPITLCHSTKFSKGNRRGQIPKTKLYGGRGGGGGGGAEDPVLVGQGKGVLLSLNKRFVEVNTLLQYGDG